MKTKALILAILMMILSLASCMGKPYSTPIDRSDNGITVSETKNNIPDTSAFIGEERAKEIALEKAGIAANGVFFDRVELDREGNIYVYEIEFRKDRTEYDAEIKADDGSILSFETDYDD